MALRVAAEAFVTSAEVRLDDSCGCVTGNDPSDAVLDELIDQASDMLAMLSAQRVIGRKTVTVRPTRKTCAPSTSTTRFERDPAGVCECCGLDGIPLGAEDPVVSQVKIDGAVIDPSTYTLHSTRNGYNLVRTNTTGTRSWPSSQSLYLADTEDDTFSITYTSGIYIDFVIKQAAIELTCELAEDDVLKTNALPNGAVSASIGGVNVQTAGALTLQERMERLASGDVGPALTRFRSLYAPTGRRLSEVWAPEVETWTFTVVS